jgi:hypothetical protein
VKLTRRGVEHGQWAVLDPRGLVEPPPPSKLLRGQLAWRWHAGRPVALPGCLGEAVRGLRVLLREREAQHQELCLPGALARFLASARLAPRFAVGEPLGREDPERDVERLPVEAAPGDGTWVKTGRLSTHAEDRSLRLRVSFGAEAMDDDSEDERRHARTTELGRALLPEIAAVEANPLIERLLRLFTGGDTRFAQAIAYWNAPGGGALFHHDAFREEPGGQLGVLFAQMAGRTAWLALSIEDLARRMTEVAELIAEGELACMAEELGERVSILRRLARDPRTLLRELASPGCGELSAAVNRPEVTSYLADAGHALVLEPGDVLLLPNHGFARTAMHSVWCGGIGVGYGVSLGVRGRK